MNDRTNPSDLLTIARKTGVVIFVSLLILLPVLTIGYAYQVFLLTFGGLLVAVFFRGLAEILSRYTRLPEKWALVVVFLLILITAVVGVWLLWPQVGRQIDGLLQQLPRSLRELENQLEQYSWGKSLSQALSDPEEFMPSQGTILAKTTNYLYVLIWTFTGIVMLIFIGIYLSGNPDLYRGGLVQTIPPQHRRRAGEVLQAVEHVLQRWLIGKFISMSTVGLLTGIGLWLLGIPLALTLGLIAALLAFIPNFGPILALIPAALLGLLQGPWMALYVIILYSTIQLVESYMITPLIQQRTVSLPPVLLIVFQVIMGVLAGSLGLIFATPLLACLLVIVEMLYIQDYLGEQIEVAGNSDPRQQE